MRIVGSQVSLAASHVAFKSASRTETLERWVGERPGRAARPTGDARPTRDAKPTRDAPPENSDEAEVGDSSGTKDRLNALVLRKMFRLGEAASAARANRAARGHAAPATEEIGSKVADATASRPGAAPRERAGWGLTYDRVETVTEQEVTAFRAQGAVQTADGRAIAFDLGLEMARTESRTTEVHVRAGDAIAVDPLVINLNGGRATLAGTFEFDLNSDGQFETIAALGAGSAWLARDKNGNGAIDDGSELFGPSTGSGFGELAALDDDGNGWIDDGDAAFADLQLWDGQTGSLSSARAAGIGAIYARAVATPFDLKDNGAVVGAVAETGVFLGEEGGAGTVQHVNVVV